MDEAIKVPFPRFIDRPKMIGIFEIDEASIGFIPMIIIVMIGFINSYESSIMLILGFVAWIITGILIHKFKENNPNGYIYHYFYRAGLYHPVMSNIKIQQTRKDIKNGAKIIPTGIVRTFIS